MIGEVSPKETFFDERLHKTGRTQTLFVNIFHKNKPFEISHSGLQYFTMAEYPNTDSRKKGTGI